MALKERVSSAISELLSKHPRSSNVYMPSALRVRLTLRVYKLGSYKKDVSIKKQVRDLDSNQWWLKRHEESRAGLAVKTGTIPIILTRDDVSH